MEADKGYMCRLLNGDDKKCYTCISESIQLEKSDCELLLSDLYPYMRRGVKPIFWKYSICGK